MRVRVRMRVFKWKLIIVYQLLLSTSKWTINMSQLFFCFFLWLISEGALAAIFWEANVCVDASGEGGRLSGWTMRDGRETLNRLATFSVEVVRWDAGETTFIPKEANESMFFVFSSVTVPINEF